MEWISAEDRLPPINTSVLAYHKNWRIEVSVHTDKYGPPGIPVGLTGDWATHWMPLPQPPEGD